MNIEFVSATIPNSAPVTDDSAAWHIRNGKSTAQENIVEFAGRLCYNSQAKMGKALNFITDRVREGHEDIIEHIVVTVRVTGYAVTSAYRLRVENRHCELTDCGYFWLVSGNLRVWLDFFRKGILLEALPILTAIAPSVFAEFDAQPAELPELPTVYVPVSDNPPQKVTMLGANVPAVDAHSLNHHGSATFLFEGVSRALTHQLVRHRLASFSQQSQRYVDLSKGGWRAVVPHAIASNPKTAQIIANAWNAMEEAYEQLRDMGIRKEDARFLLPNATETSIVTTMNFAAWQHFCWLRAVDRAAQWEIRAMGQAVLGQLYQIAPDVFQEHMAAMEALNRDNA